MAINIRGYQNCAYFKDCVALGFIPDGSNETTFATLSAMTSDALIEAINNSTVSKRLIPVERVDNYAPTMSDNKTKEWDSGDKTFTREGIETVVVAIKNGDAQTAKMLNSMNCKGYRVILFGKNQMKCEVDAETKTKIRGIKVSIGSFNAKLVPAKASGEPEYVELSFTFDSTHNVELERVFDYSPTLDYNVTEVLVPLIPIEMTSSSISSITTAGFSFLALDERGNGVSGIESTDIVLTKAGVAVAKSISESATVSGFYTVTFTAAQDSGSVLSFSIDADGFDYSGVGTLTVTIPS